MHSLLAFTIATDQIGQVLIAVILAILGYYQRKNAKRSDEIHILVNSQKDLLEARIKVLEAEIEVLKAEVHPKV